MYIIHNKILVFYLVDRNQAFVRKQVTVSRNTPLQISELSTRHYCIDENVSVCIPLCRIVLLITVHTFSGQAEECKKKWNGIRDSFRRSRQKRVTKSGQASTTITKYKFEDILEFLIPHLADKKGLSNIPDESVNESNASQQPNTLHESILENIDFHASGETGEALTMSRATTPSCQASLGSCLTGTKRKRKVVNEIKSSESASSHLMAYLLTEKEKQSNQNERQHPVDIFLAGIATSLKSLNLIRLHAAKGRIFNIAQEYELEQLKEDKKNQYT